MKVFLTGATGCVGVHVLKALLARPGFEVLAMVRDPARVPAGLRHHPRLRLIRGDLGDLEPVLPVLEGIEAAVLIATAWGGPQTMAVTCEATVTLARALQTRGCRRIVYFATASVLDAEGRLLDIARDHGTDYIRAKHALVAAMEGVGGPMEVCGLFPTLVMGGGPGSDAPASHLARLLPQVLRWLWLIRFIDAEARLNMIHAADIATMVRHLLEQPAGAAGPLRLVLGNPAQSIDDLVREACAHYGRRRLVLVTLRPWLAEAMIHLFRIRLTPWDRHCMAHPDQSHPRAVNPASFGLPVHMPDLAAGLRMLETGPGTGR